MKVKVQLTLDIDNNSYYERFIDPDEPDSRRRDVIIRDDVRGMAAASVVQFFDQAGVLKGYDVDEWKNDEMGIG